MERLYYGPRKVTVTHFESYPILHIFTSVGVAVHIEFPRVSAKLVQQLIKGDDFEDNETDNPSDYRFQIEDGAVIIRVESSTNHQTLMLEFPHAFLKEAFEAIAKGETFGV